MKAKIFLSLLLFSISFTGICTTWTITNSGFTFTPATIYIVLGDSVNFVIASVHNAREVSQTTWNSNGTTALTGGFQTAFGGGMVLPAQLAVGTHYYVCTPHASIGMKGTIIVCSAAPSPPLTISGNTTICSGSSNTYNITSVTGATSYTWTLPSGWAGSSTSNSISATSSTTSGNITVTANNTCGSSAAQSLSVTVDSVNISVSVSGVTLMANDSGATYQWFDCNGMLPISGQTNQSFTATANGNYAVIVTKNNCTDTSSCHIINNVGIIKTIVATTINIYPNPSNGKFNLEMSKIEKGFIEIYNMQGMKIYQFTITNPKSEIDLSNQTKGIYFLNLYYKQKVLTKTIIME